MADGTKSKFNDPIAYGNYEQNEMQRPMELIMEYVFNLPNETTNFRREFIQTMARYLPSLQSEEAEELRKSYMVFETPWDMSRLDEFQSIRYKETNYYALPENTKTLEFMKDFKAATTFAKLDANRLVQIYTQLEDGTVLGTLTADEQEAVDYGKEMIYDYLTGQMKDADYYGKLIRELAGAADGVDYNYSTYDRVVAEGRELSTQEVQTYLHP
jgi:hypothetical protein